MGRSCFAHSSDGTNRWPSRTRHMEPAAGGSATARLRSSRLRPSNVSTRPLWKMSCCNNKCKLPDPKTAGVVWARSQLLEHASFGETLAVSARVLVAAVFACVSDGYLCGTLTGHASAARRPRDAGSWSGIASLRIWMWASKPIILFASSL